MRALWEDAEQLTAAAASKSLRVLLVLHTQAVHGTTEDLKRRMLSHGDRVLATAVVGTPFWRVVVAGVRANGRENVEFFADEETALEWLVAQ